MAFPEFVHIIIIIFSSRMSMDVRCIKSQRVWWLESIFHVIRNPGKFIISFNNTSFIFYSILIFYSLRILYFLFKWDCNMYWTLFLYLLRKVKSNLISRLDLWSADIEHIQSLYPDHLRRKLWFRINPWVFMIVCHSRTLTEFFINSRYSRK